MAKQFFLRRRNLGRLYFFVLILCGIFFAAGFIIGSQQSSDFLPKIPKKETTKISLKNTQPPENVDVDFSLFWDVWQRVTTQYLEKSKLNPKKLVEGAISGLVTATGDPYSAFLSAEQNAESKQELAGIYEGVGIQIGVKSGKIVVIAPLAGTPAAAAGLRANDAILQIDSKPTVVLSLPEAVSLIRGPAGTKVKLTLQRGDQSAFEKELVRAKITVKSVEVSFEDLKAKKVAILKLSRFGDNTNSEWDEAASKILENNVSGLILDLRNNPGGFLAGAVYVSSEFVKGRIVGQKTAEGGAQFFTAQRSGKLTKIPMVVLVNGGTASASEIVAGALQVKKRAKIVGETTFGKGTVQDAADLPGGAGLHLTVAQWLLPTGGDINGVGLKPDIEVKLEEGEKDLQLEKGKEVLKTMI